MMIALDLISKYYWNRVQQQRLAAYRTGLRIRLGGTQIRTRPLRKTGSGFDLREKKPGQKNIIHLFSYLFKYKL